MSTTLHAGDSAAMSVTSGVWCGATVWIDFNQDEVFDSTENLFHSYVGADPSYTYNFYITIPPGTAVGSYRMRVISAWGSDGYTVGGGNGWGGCGSFQYGNFDDFTINIGGGCSVVANANHASVCHGDSVMLSGTGSNMTFAWSDGVNEGVAFMPDSTVTYTLTGTDTITTCVAVDTITVTVNPLPVVSISPPGFVCNNAPTFAITVSPLGGILSGSGVVTGTTNFDPSLASVGNDTILYSYTDNNSCSNSVSTFIPVVICAGINGTIELNSISLYPVPINNYLNLDLPASSETIEMKIYNLEGKLILEQTLLNGQNRINMESISAGVYSLQLKNSANIATQKIVVVK